MIRIFAQLNGHNGFKLSAAQAKDLLGHSVSAADVNGDGFSDLIVGADKADGDVTDSGATYVIFGKANGFAPNFKVSALNGRNGFRIVGAMDGDLLGRAVSGLGDVNGDGVDDIIVGDGDESAGYVIFGTRSGFSATFNVSSIDGYNGFKLRYFRARGEEVRGAGDVNGDGLDDIIVGSRYAGPNQAGAAYVVFGRANSFPAFIDLESLDGEEGFKMAGTVINAQTGASVSGAGDINRDGFDDVIIGAPTLVGGPRPGDAYVVFGKATGFANLNLAELDGTDGFKLSGENEYDSAGISVSRAGDVNGDGFDDLIVGAYRAFRGKAYIIFGRTEPFPANLDLSTIDGLNGFTVVGPDEGYDSGIGKSVSAAGDVNGDGIADIIISAYDGSNGNGASYVVFGSQEGFPSSLVITALNGVNGFKIRGIQGGHSPYFPVSGAGDVNGDGFTDLVIGAYGESTRGRFSGTAYVVFGGDPGRLKIAQSGMSATYTDPDGDKVTVTTSAGIFTPELFVMRKEGFGFQLESLTLTNPTFTKTNLTFSAIQRDANQDGMTDGDGSVNVGAIDATGVDLGKVKIAGDLGQIDAGDGNPARAALALLKVRSLGTHGTATQNAATASLHGALAGDLGKLKVKGDVASGVTLAVEGRLGTGIIGGNLDGATITALGILAPVKAAEAVALRKLTIGGDVSGSRILAGYDFAGLGANADASIGSVRVRGTWTASDLVAGIADATGDGFGRNDAPISGGSASMIAQIARITIKGAAIGSAGDSTDHFGITAEIIGRAKIGSSVLALTPEKNDVLLDPANTDFRLVEI